MRCSLSVLFINVVAIIAAVAVSCGDGGSAASTCDPGVVQACACGGGEPDGTQVCNADGSAWSECDCGSDSDVDTDCSGDGVCDNPPANYCAEDGRLVEYTGAATCVEDECYYETTLTDCNDVTEGYACFETDDGGAICGFIGADGYVEGEFQTSLSSSVLGFAGKLSQDDPVVDDYYGYCRYNATTDEFDFEVGDDKLENINGATQLYVKFTGVLGPYTEDVYSDPDGKIPKEGPHTLFGTAVIRNGGYTFSFSQPDPTGNPDCYVELFAKAAASETTPIADAPIDYYVGLHCQNLGGVEDSGGTPLTAFDGYFFLDGCVQVN